ncbi:MAG: adenylate/guanylate cyclase domain-containing protein [Myxococcota bacterium]
MDLPLATPAPAAAAPATGFAAELDRQAARLMVPGGLFTAVVWLPFIVSDRALHPAVPAIPLVRVGLTGVSLLALAVHFLARERVRPQVRLHAILAYMQVGSALVAALSGADPAYVGGYLAILMAGPALPLSRARTLGTWAVSVATFATAATMLGAPLGSPALRYSLTNLAAVGVAVPFLILILDRTRYRSWRLAEANEAQRRELAADKARIDQLLHNILPGPIVTELKATDRVEPRHHGEVTVLFTDFAGFTTIAEQVSAEELVAELDSCFSTFDAIIARRGLEKLKTIGDSYMAAAGVPVPRRTHTVDAVLAALEMARVIAARAAVREAAGRPTWGVRIGIHTGPLVAGVVGQTRFAYDVWGDTVNLASRMESASEPGRVNVSSATAARIAGLFVLEPRGRVPAKNKGLVEMFFVAGIRPELSVDGLGIEPNATFWTKARA